MRKVLLLWSGQVLLAVFFAYAGWLKLSQTPAMLSDMGWHWATEVPPALITFIGVAELLGAVGIILPAALRIMTWLTAAAASGMVLVQVAAIVLHVARGEYANLWLNLLVVALAGAVLAARLPDALKRKQPSRLAASD